MEKYTKVPSQSFSKTQIPSVKRNETEVLKNKVFKPQVPNVFNPKKNMVCPERERERESIWSNIE
jgi:hypothetical protein